MLFHVKGVFRVCVGQVLVFRVLRDVVLIREERAHTSKLQDTFPAVHDRDFVLRHKLFATMSSDELKKMAATIKEFLFVATILIIISLTCTA